MKSFEELAADRADEFAQHLKSARRFAIAYAAFWAGVVLVVLALVAVFVFSLV